MPDYYIPLITAIIIQVGSLFGMFFVFFLVLSKLQKWTQRNYFRSVGWKGILWTAWLGTPIHEYSHVIFAKIFRHRIDEVALFEPNYETGELGHVNHSYNGGSLYQNIGIFFIGSAPLIFGSFLLIVLLRFLVPNGEEIFTALTSDYSIVGLAEGVRQSFQLLFSYDNLSNIYFWLFLYLSFCIASHLAPSKADRKGVWYGLVLILIILITANIFLFMVNIDITGYILIVSNWMSISVAVFTYATIISFIHFLISLVIFLPFKRNPRKMDFFTK